MMMIGELQSAVLDCVLLNKQTNKQTKLESLSLETDNPHYGVFIFMVNMTIDSEETHLWAPVEKIS